MKIGCCAVLLFFALLAGPASATVIVSSPRNGATVTTSVQYVASANTSTCTLGIAAMGVYVDDSLMYVQPGANLSTTVQLSAGKHKSVVQAWDYCGAASVTTSSITVSGTDGVFVTSPTSGSTDGSPVTYAATAVSSCSLGVASMAVYVNDQLSYLSAGSTLSARIAMSAGPQKTVVQEWDNCGHTSSTSVPVTVTGTTLSNLQATSGWNQWGELAPVYDICSSSCPGITWSMDQKVSSPSLSGKATRFTIGGSTPYSDVLWSNKLIGQGTTLGMPDTEKTLLPSIHNLTYSADVYVTNFAATQDLEFDVNMYMFGVGMEWGTECNHLADGVWDIWDNVNAKWVPTSAPCSLNDNAWNHVTLQVQRLANNSLRYKTITVNDTTYTINETVPPFSVPSGWYGMTVNYQMDGNYRQATNTTYLDNLNISYW